MAFTYDTATDVGRVRLIVPDRDAADPVFQDDEITTFVTLEGDVRRAAALALETIAADTVATLRTTKVLGLEVDGGRASKELMGRAAELRKQADDADARSGNLFDWAEMSLDDFSARERIEAELLRAGV